MTRDERDHKLAAIRKQALVVQVELNTLEWLIDELDPPQRLDQQRRRRKSTTVAAVLNEDAKV